MGYVLCAVMLLAAVPAVRYAAEFWIDLNGSFFHQPFVLAAALYFGFRERKKLLSAVKSGGGILPPAILIPAVAAFLYYVTAVAGLTRLFCIVLPALLMSAAVFLGGWKPAPVVPYLMALTGLSFPYPVIFMTVSEWFLQKGSLLLSFLLLKAVYWKTTWHETTLTAFGRSLQVGLPCSGINSFIMLIPLVVVSAYLYRVTRRRLLAILACLPLTVWIFNTLRITSMYLAVLFTDFHRAVEHFHTIGPVFFFFNAVFVLVLLRRQAPAPCPEPAPPAAQTPRTAVLTGLFICLLAGLFIVPQHDRLPVFPTAAVASVFRSAGWNNITVETVSPLTRIFRGTIGGRFAAAVMVGVKYSGFSTYPPDWKRFGYIHVGSGERRRISVNGGSLKLRLRASIADAGGARDLMMYTYLVGNRSAYTITGAGLLRLGTVMAGRGINPYIMIKLSAEKVAGRRQAHALTDNFLTAVMPGLRSLLAGTFVPVRLHPGFELHE